MSTRKMKKGSHFSSSSPFISKVFQILEKSENQASIRWNAQGNAFSIFDVTAFASDVLPMFFKHRNYSSFVRQLNMYGFHKIKSEESENSFAHPLFKKNNKTQLYKIKKVRRDSSDEESDSDDDAKDKSPTHSNNDSESNRLLKEMESRIQKFEGFAEKLEKQAKEQAEQLKSLTEQIESVKTMSTQRYDVLTKMLASNRMESLPNMSMPFMNQFMGMAMGMGMENLLPLLATQKLTTEGFMEMHKLQANNGRNFAEKTNPSANSVPIKRDPAGNDKRQDVSEKLMNREQQQGGFQRKLVKKEESSVNLCKTEAKERNANGEGRMNSGPLSNGESQSFPMSSQLPMLNHFGLSPAALMKALYQQNQLNELMQAKNERETQEKSEDNDSDHRKCGVSEKNSFRDLYQFNLANYERLLRGSDFKI